MLRSLLRRPRTGLLALLAGLLPLLGHAQVNLYTFSQSAGTYTDLPAPTVLATSTTSSVTTTDDALYPVTIPFSFTFNGVAYTSLSVNTNGYLTFGSTASTATGYTPISATRAYAGAVAAVGGDLYGSNTAGALGELSYQALGTGPSRTLVVQWKNYARYVGGYVVENLNFQIQLDEGTNVVRLVYGSFSPAATSTPQVGLRGATNAVYNNRTTTTNWSASTAGSASNATMTLSSTVKPVSGLTYAFTPPTPCTAPPTAGTAVATLPNGCGTVSSTLSLTGSATGTGVTYQWQQSSTGAAGSFTPITGATSATYSATGLTVDTYFQAVVTCSGQSATSSVAVVRVNSATATASTYATLPVVENFESWVGRCGNQEVPSLNWIATPITGNNSWRRNDQGFSTAGWSYINDEPAPYPITSSQGSYSARFHSYGTAAGGTGSIDLYANLSAAGTKTLTFDYYNASGTDKLEVQLSTDGGATFPTTLLTLGASASFNGQSVVISSTSATAAIRFKATSDFGADDIGIDKLRLDLTPACAAVAFSPTTAITQNSATINFGAASGGSTYSLTYSPGGATPQTVTPGAVPLTGLQPYTLYTVTVTTNCGGGQTNTATTSFRTPIGNDECSGAVALTPGMPGAACSAQTYTTLDATNSAGVTSACAAPVGGDVWFSFVATGATHTITVTPTFDFDAVIDLRSSTGGCPGTSIICQNASASGGSAGTETLQASGLTNGATYYVRVYSTFASTSYNFDICITTPPNVPCAQVTNAAVTTASGTATASTGQLTFTAAAGASTYYLTLAPTAGGATSTGTLSGSPVALNGLTPNTPYTLTISTNCSNGGVSTPVTVIFTSAPAPTPPANDDCAGAIALTPGTACTPVSGTVAAATQSLAAITCGGFTSTATPVADVWYQFTATGTQYTVSIVGNFDGVLDVRTGTCASSTNFACSDASGNNETLMLATTAGTTYYLRYYPYLANPATPTFTICVTAPAPDLVVDGNNSPYSASGTYNNVTINSGGAASLSADLTVNGTLTINSGGTLNTAASLVLGTGNFVLAAGGTLGIGGANGISAGPAATGAVRNTGPTRSFSTDATYVYNGTAAQSTGAGLPGQVRSLTTTNANPVTLTSPVSVAQVLTVGGAGNLALNGQALTLLSSASGTALVVNSGAGTVVGNATVQRYIDPSLNPGLGYRHYSAPVANSTVADLATAGFSPEVSQAGTYNSSATPGTTTPFPTVFGYDQSRVTLANSYAPFDRGYVVPASTATALAVGQGYTVNIGSGQLVDFVGTLNNGPLPLALSRVASNTDAGWQLVGNPYPAPLDYSLVAPADRTNLDAAIYVFSSTSQYVGQYRAYANGVGGNPVLPLGQAFFARVSAGQTSGTLTFRNSQRLSAPEPTPFQRPWADARPRVELALRGASGPLTDVLYAYAQPGATPAFDGQFDAAKLANSTGLNLSSAAASGEALAIDGRPAFTAATVLPLAVGVPAAGPYTLTAAALNNLPAGLDAYLADAQTGQSLPLVVGQAYAFSVTAAQATALLTGRFSLLFRPNGPLAAMPASLPASAVTLYPNPAHAAFTVLVPAVAGAPAVQAELLNALGQVVRRQAAPASADGTRFTVETADLAAGVYTLRLQVGALSLAKRVVIQ